MQLHCLHANAFGFETHEHDPNAEGRRQATATLDSCLVVWIAVEAADRRDIGAVVRNGTEQITEVAEQLGERQIALVPCSQLSETPAAESVTATLFDRLASELDPDTVTVPVGSAFAFDLDARGHPFASQQFNIAPERTAERSDWFRLDADGTESVSLPDLDGASRRLIERDRDPIPAQTTPAGGPALVGGESETTAWVRPGGVLLRELLCDWLTERLVSRGATAVGRYTDREPDDTAMLDQFVTPSTEFPLRIFEPDGLSPEEPNDPHPTLTAITRTAGALDELLGQVELVDGLLAELGLEYQPVIRTSKSVFEDRQSWFLRLASTVSRPALVEVQIRDERRLEIEFVLADADGNRIAVPTVSVEGTASASDGEELRVLRCRPVDSPMALLTALLGQTAQRERPQLPDWLSPVQLRFIPVEDEHRSRCEELADTFESAGIRVDIDDRDEPVGARLRDADGEWIPYDAVVGTEECEGEKVGVTIRREQTQRTFTPDELRDHLADELAGWPRAPLPFPRRRSRQPQILFSA